MRQDGDHTDMQEDKGGMACLLMDPPYVWLAVSK